MTLTMKNPHDGSIAPYFSSTLYGKPMIQLVQSISIPLPHTKTPMTPVTLFSIGSDHSGVAIGRVFFS